MVENSLWFYLPIIWVPHGIIWFPFFFFTHANAPDNRINRGVNQELHTDVSSDQDAKNCRHLTSISIRDGIDPAFEVPAMYPNVCVKDVRFTDRERSLPAPNQMYTIETSLTITHQKEEQVLKEKYADPADRESGTPRNSSKYKW